MKNKVVVFTENNARILTNPVNFADLMNMPNAVVNPNLDALSGVPPHYWKFVNGGVVEMSTKEKARRDTHIARFGAMNEIVCIKIAAPSRIPYLVAISGLLFLAYFAKVLFHL